MGLSSHEWKMTLEMILILLSYIARYHLCGTVNYQTVYVQSSKKPQCSVQIIHNLLKATGFFYTFPKKYLQFPLHKLQLLVPAYVGMVPPVGSVLSRSFTLPVGWGITPFTSRF